MLTSITRKPIDHDLRKAHNQPVDYGLTRDLSDVYKVMIYKKGKANKDV